MFDKLKKILFSEDSNSGCGWAPSPKTSGEVVKEGRVKILGTVCANCTELYDNTVLAIKEANLDLEVSKIEDPEMITAYGVMSTPALALDYKVLSYGKVLTKEEIIELLKNNL